MHWRRLLSASAVISALAGLSSLGAADWPQFRGPGARGISDESDLPTSWSRTENVLWRREIPGRGWSSPIVRDGLVFLTTAVSDGEVEEAKKGLYYGGRRSKPSPDRHRWLVLCLDARTGEIRWQRTAHSSRPATPRHIKNTYASETPVADGERVYAYFGDVGIFAYTTRGELVWSRPVEPRKTRYDWGTAASPALHDGRLYILNDNEEDSWLLALEAASGKELWKVARHEKSNWSTPFVWETEERTEIVTAGTGKVRSYDLSGGLLWELEGMSSIAIPTPFAAQGLLYVSSGFVLDPLRPVYAIRPGARGNLSVAGRDKTHPSVAWYHSAAGPYNPSPIVYGDHFYTLYDRGFVGCLGARTGITVYKKRRISTEAKAFTASPWAYGGLLFCLSEDGDTFVVRPGPEFEVVGKNSLGEMCMATPAIADGCLYIRTISALYAIGSAKPGASTPASTGKKGES